MSELENPSIEQMTDTRLIRRAMWISGLFLALHPMAALIDRYCFWGLDFLRYYSFWHWGIFALLGLLFFASPSRLIIIGFAKRIQKLPFWLIVLFVALLATAAFYFYRTETHFLGDGDMLLRDLSLIGPNGASRAFYRSPLVLSLMQVVDAHYEATPLEMYRLYSWVSGLLYLLACFSTARILGESTAARGLIFGALITPGFIQLFFGYVENYALLFPFVLGYLLTGYRALKQKGSLLLPIGFLGILVPIHFMTVSLWPSFLVLAYCRSFGADPKATFLLRLPKMLFVFFMPVALWLIILSAISFDITAYFQTPKNHQLPLFSSADQYGIFSFLHLFDLANLYLLTASFSLMAMAIVPLRKLCQLTPGNLFLGIASVCPVALSFVFNPEIGVFRDWDALSMVALPLTLWLAMLLVAQIRQNGARWQIGVLFVGISMFHSSLWIGINANEARGVARYEHILRNHSHPKIVHAWAWEPLGIYYFNRGAFALSRDAYLQALEYTPGNARFWNAVGLSYLQSGEAQLALPYFERAVEKNPQLAEAYANMGSIYLAQKDFLNAQHYLNLAIQIRPDFVPVHVMLGQVHFVQGRWESSVQHYRAAVSYDPNHIAAWHGLGAGDFEGGSVDKAIDAFRHVIALRSDHAEAIFNLALCFDRLGQSDSSAVYLSRAATIDPSRFGSSSGIENSNR